NRRRATPWSASGRCRRTRPLLIDCRLWMALTSAAGWITSGGILVRNASREVCPHSAEASTSGSAPGSPALRCTACRPAYSAAWASCIQSCRLLYCRSSAGSCHVRSGSISVPTRLPAQRRRYLGGEDLEPPQHLLLAGGFRLHHGQEVIGIAEERRILLEPAHDVPRMAVMHIEVEQMIFERLRLVDHPFAQPTIPVPIDVRRQLGPGLLPIRGRKHSANGTNA